MDWYQARTDDLIVSAGNKIAAPEVESVLLDHPKVKECGVIGIADAERGHVVKAFVVLDAGRRRRTPPPSSACRTTSRRRSPPTSIRVR